MTDLVSDAFLNEIAPDPNAVQEMFVGGIMAIPQRLTELEYIPENHRGVWITTVIRMDDFGQPREAFLSVYREPQHHKFRARKLFVEAPEEANIRLCDLNYHAFDFPPSANCSNWVSSSDLNMAVMKSNNFSKDGLYDNADWASINITDVSFRLVVTPTDDVNKASVSLVALPCKLTEISSLMGNPTGLAPGYPVVEVLRLTGMMTGIQEPLRRDGFPFLPCLLNTGDNAPVPDIGAVKVALYAFWRSFKDANMGDIEMWRMDTVGPAAPNTDQVDCMYRWPAIELAADSDGNESSYDEELGIIEDIKTEVMWNLAGRVQKIMDSELPDYPKKKIFKPKCPKVSELKSYNGGAPEKFWSNFPQNPNLEGGSPYKINADLLIERAELCGVADMSTVRAVANDIRNGCDLKVDREMCKPTRSTNAPSAYKDGRKVTDALASWIESQIVAGPFDTAPEDAVVSGIQTKDKPNGSCRIIINQSSPKKKSINDCLDKKAYNSIMGGTKELLRAINYCGRGCLFCKADWNNAYKHFHVKSDNLRYNWIRWLNKYFVELCLVFGCVSSVGLYDRGARVVIWIALRESGFPFWLAIQHLDDLCAVGPKDSPLLQNFYQTYCDLCKDLGISLADTSDPDKAFSPTTKGQMLGINFDSEKWIWYLDESKLNRYVNDINGLIMAKETDLRTVKSVVGKILYISPLIPGSKYHLSELHAINDYTGEKNLNDIVLITKEAKEQLRWWLVMARLAGEGMPIPSGYDECPPWALMGDSDAAGGTKFEIGHGMGAVMDRGWAYVPWPKLINSDETCESCNSKWRHKLSFLELNGHLLHLLAFANECRGKNMATRIDNAGTVIKVKKGYDLKCKITDCLIRSINHVAVAMKTRAYVVDIRRCSTDSAKAADFISKRKWGDLEAVMPDRELDPRRIPRNYLKWLDKPRVDEYLGRNIVVELMGPPWFIKPSFPQI